MAKSLPYFKFIVSEWSDGDITLESFEVQGLFINICAYYWSNEGNISLEKTKKKFKCDDENYNILVESEIIKVIDGKIKISFMDEQLNDRDSKALINKENGKKGGRPRNQIESEEKPNGLILETETKANTKALREEKRREEEKKEEESILEIKNSNSEFDQFDEIDLEKSDILKTWIKYKKEKNEEIKSSMQIESIFKNMLDVDIGDLKIIINQTITSGAKNIIWNYANELKQKNQKNETGNKQSKNTYDETLAKLGSNLY